MVVQIDIEKNMKDAIQRAVASHCVAIDISRISKQPPAWGTGCLLRHKQRQFIVTCRHLIEPLYGNSGGAKGLAFLYNPEEANNSQFVEKREFKSAIPKHKYKKTDPRSLSIKDIFFSDEATDLALIELSSDDRDVMKWSFYELKETNLKSPLPDAQIFLMGFSSELAVKITKRGDVGVFAYFEGTKIVDKNISVASNSKYNPAKHFLIDFVYDENSALPTGLSGCGVWYLAPTKKGEIWKADIHLAGIQSAWFPREGVLYATRIEELIELLGCNSKTQASS